MSFPTSWYYLGIWLESLRKTAECRVKKVGCPNRVLNWSSLESKSEALPYDPTCWPLSYLSPKMTGGVTDFMEHPIQILICRRQSRGFWYELACCHVLLGIYPEGVSGCQLFYLELFCCRPAPLNGRPVNEQVTIWEGLHISPQVGRAPHALSSTLSAFRSGPSLRGACWLMSSRYPLHLVITGGSINWLLADPGTITLANRNWLLSRFLI